MTGVNPGLSRGIKSVQQGSLTRVGDGTQQNVTITAVDTTKAFVLWQGAAVPGAATDPYGVMVWLNSSTQVAVQGYTGTGTNQFTVRFTVVEFY